MNPLPNVSHTPGHKIKGSAVWTKQSVLQLDAVLNVHSNRSTLLSWNQQLLVLWESRSSPFQKANKKSCISTIIY